MFLSTGHDQTNALELLEVLKFGHVFRNCIRRYNLMGNAWGIRILKRRVQKELFLGIREIISQLS